jgi:hypothetical protein
MKCLIKDAAALSDTAQVNPKFSSLFQNRYISDLPLEYRKTYNKTKPYPVREVYQTYRIRRLDGTEWLKAEAE